MSVTGSWGGVLADAMQAWEVILVVLYLAVVGYLGWLGYQRTRSWADYVIAGRSVHPFVMAMSYGATFISTSAIVGFGGVAGMFGMNLLWLVFLNIFAGIFIAFIFLGSPTRRMGHRLDAHTFPELLGERFQSRFMQIGSGGLITLFIPLYSAAVLIAGCEFLSKQFNLDYGAALLLLGAVVALYVVMGGLKGIMYTDALQGTIMLVSMVVLLVWTYVTLGGLTSSHEQLGAMSDQVFAGFQSRGHRGWTRMPAFGWGETKYDLWWLCVSTIIMGVGIGVLAQPQLVVRFMTVKSRKELNRAAMIGGIFILAIPGTAYVVGSLSNVYFYQVEQIHGRLVGEPQVTDIVTGQSRAGIRTLPCTLLHIDTTGDGVGDVQVIGEGREHAAELLPRAEIQELPDGSVMVYPRATSYTRAVVRRSDGRWMLNTDSIIPAFIKSAMPRWFGLLFLLTLLAAAMSTLSSQFHNLGTSLGHDVYGKLRGASSITVTRLGVIAGILLAVLLSYFARGGYIVARATAIYFGLCASAFLPAFVGGLFWRRMTRAGASVSMLVGAATSLFWLTFIKGTEAEAIGLVQLVTGGKTSLLADYPNWPMVDPILIALPLSIITAVVVSLLTQPPDEAHLKRCFG